MDGKGDKRWMKWKRDLEMIKTEMNIVGKLQVTDDKLLVLTIGEFRNEERLDLRIFTKSGANWIPTIKGCNFSSEYLEPFVEMVLQLNG